MQIDSLIETDDARSGHSEEPKAEESEDAEDAEQVAEADDRDGSQDMPLPDDAVEAVEAQSDAEARCHFLFVLWPRPCR